jgi:hypothetical protein
MPIPRRADPKARQLTLSVASGGLPVPEHARRPTAAISTDVPMRMFDRHGLVKTARLLARANGSALLCPCLHR